MSRKLSKNNSIVDVAKKAGVSIATVSRVLNGSPRVKESTRKQIMDIADRMGYSLAAGRPGPKPDQPSFKKRVAFVSFMDRYHSSGDLPATFLALQRGVKEGMKGHGVAIQRYCIDTEAELPDELVSGSFDGFILEGLRPHPTVERFLRTKPCCWVTNTPWTPTWGDHVMIDHREAGMIAAEYLINHACRKLAIIKLGQADRVSALREEGFIYAAGKQGVRAQALAARSPLPDVRTSYPELVYVDEIITQFKKTAGSADGIFFESDRSLATLYPVMVREKLIVPGKTVLIGCNNQQTFFKGISPHPATIEVHFEQIGRMGTSQLLWRMQNPDCRKVRAFISPTLISLS
jgi:LacI family transcriptional regulator